MLSFLVEVELFEKTDELYPKIQSLQPAWLREFREAVDADRVFIWGKRARQPHINGSGKRPSFCPGLDSYLICATPKVSIQTPTLKTLCWQLIAELKIRSNP